MIPDESPTSRPSSQHNLPPDPIQTVEGQMEDVIAKYRTRIGEIAESARKKIVVDRDTAGQAGDILAIAANVLEKLDADRKEVTTPHYDASRRGKMLADEAWEPAEFELDLLRERLQDWNDAEDARIEEQRLEQQRQMQAMRAKAAPPPAPGPRADINYSAPTAAPEPSRSLELQPARRRKVRGDLGSVSGNVDKVEYEIIDIRALPDIILQSDTVKAAALAVVKSMARHMGDIPGVKKSTTGKLKVQR